MLQESKFTHLKTKPLASLNNIQGFKLSSCHLEISHSQDKNTAKRKPKLLNKLTLQFLVAGHMTRFHTSKSDSVQLFLQPLIPHQTIIIIITITINIQTITHSISQEQKRKIKIKNLTNEEDSKQTIRT